MKAFVLTKVWKFAFAITSCLMFAVILLGIIYYEKNESQVRVDRSNAMRVTKLVTSEQATPVISVDFFTEYRLERDRIRSERTDLLRDVIKNEKNDNDRKLAQDAILKIMSDKQKESDIENLIRSRGFADALIFIREHSVNAVIKSSSLTKEDVIQVADIISRITGIKAEDITITAKP
jgi:stage III sporulation protein AH